jgi:hypothetical protein
MPETAETTTDPTDIGPYFWLTLVCSTGELAQHMGCGVFHHYDDARAYADKLVADNPHLTAAVLPVKPAE